MIKQNFYQKQIFILFSLLTIISISISSSASCYAFGQSITTSVSSGDVTVSYTFTLENFSLTNFIETTNQMQDAADTANNILQTGGSDALTNVIENIPDDTGHSVTGDAGNFGCENGITITYPTGNNQPVAGPGPNIPNTPYVPPAPDPAPYIPPCSPNCSCASNTCIGGTCSDGCGGNCSGTKQPDCADNSSYCTGTTYPSSNGCGSCTGAKPSLNGECDTPNISCSKPANNLCKTGSPTTVTLSGSYWTWSCDGICSGQSASCSVRRECPWQETSN